MKDKIVFPLVIVLFLCIRGFVLAQKYEAKDSSTQFNFPNNGGTININNYLNKSDEYKALTKQLEDLDKEIQDKRDDYAALEVAKSERLDKCRQSLNLLNEKRNALANNIQQFKEDVIRLTETFKNATDKSQLFLKARELFEEGKFRETNFLLNPKELTAMGEDGLEKSKTAGQLFLIKDKTKALDYTDPLRIDSSVFCFQQSLRYFYDVQTLYDLARFYKDNNFHEKGIEYYNILILYPKAEDWQIANAYLHLGDLYTTKGDLQQALTSYTKAQHIYISLSKPPLTKDTYLHNLAVTYQCLGKTHNELGCGADALICFNQFNQLEKNLHEAFPQNENYKNGLAVSYQYLGNMHTALDSFQQALTFFKQHNDLEKELHEAFPQNVEFKNLFAISYSKLGETYTSLNSFPQALIFFKEFNRLVKELHEVFPQNIEFKNSLAISYSKLGESYTALDSFPQALTFFQKDKDIIKELHKAFPQNVAYKNSLAISYNKLGDTYTSLNNLPQALTFFEEGSRLAKELYSASQDNVSFKNDLAVSYYKLGDFSRDNLKDKIKARAYLKQAEALWIELVRDAPKYVKFQRFLGIVQQDLADLDK